ncbi:MAG: hypothetical protein JSV18_00070 [Candidatus Bathyarchaeota archaeon]|nr:MAG: hypothetical protein JSV18_00070 [Candidatus Bathyarchaeota archaeon]
MKISLDKIELTSRINALNLTTHFEREKHRCEIYYDTASYVMDPHTLKDGYKMLIFVIHNAYPQYEVHFPTVVLHNIGTIPIHIIAINIWDPTGVLNWVWTAPPPASPAEGFFWKDLDGDGVYDPGEEEIMNIDIVNFVCVQIDPCQSTKGEVDIDFKQPAEECHTYYFALEFVGIQWNKA